VTRTVIAAGLVMAALSAMSAQPGPSESFATLMARGQAALQAEDYATAQAMLEKAVAARPGSIDAHYMLGRAYGQDKKYQFAAQSFRAVLKLSPGHVQALVDLGTIEETMGRLEEAESRYRQALPNPRARRGLASLLSKLGRQKEAIAALREALAADRDDAETRFQLGMALMQNEECAAAVPELEEVVRRESKHLGALFNLGNCLNRIGSRDEAKGVLDRFQQASLDAAQRVDRRRRAYFLSLEADRRLGSGDAAGAARSLKEAIGLQPDDGGTHALLGQALEAVGDLPGALSAYRRAAELSPLDAMMLVELGRLLGKSGRFADALPHLKKAAQIDPAMPEPHLFLAAAYQQLGRSIEASQEQAIYRRLAAAANNPR